MTFSCALEAFRFANARSGAALFEYATIGLSDEPIEMDGGARLVPDTTIDGAPSFDIVFVVSGLISLEYRNSRLEAWLRARSRTGSAIAPLGTATLLAARAGLLDGHRCVTHWTLYDRLRNDFPRVRLVKRLFCLDGKVITAAGGVAAYDLGLALVKRIYGVEAIGEQAELALHDRPRPAAGHQRADVAWRYEVEDARLVRAIEIMEASIEQPLSVVELVSKVGVSPRQLERLCHDALQRGPRRLSQEIRLRHARNLLRTTRVPIADVALACGFADASHLSRRYRELFGAAPSLDRDVDGAADRMA
jgi:transcriptional regulator GlxA family with amidase domain